MTKYVINSGGLKKYPDRAKEYFNELLKDLGPNPKLLWCFFATKPEEQKERFEKYVSVSKDTYPVGINPVHEFAEEEKFAKQVQDVDLIKLHGGHTLLLLEALRNYDLPKLFANKVVSGHSAGSHILCSHNWSPGRRKCFDGYGILPYKFLSHYNSNHGSDDPRATNRLGSSEERTSGVWRYDIARVSTRRRRF